MKASISPASSMALSVFPFPAPDRASPPAARSPNVFSIRPGCSSPPLMRKPKMSEGFLPIWLPAGERAPTHSRVS